MFLVELITELFGCFYDILHILMFWRTLVKDVSKFSCLRKYADLVVVGSSFISLTIYT